MREFRSRFAKDLDEMIAMLIVTGLKESSYITRAKSFDKFCADSKPECSELTEALCLEWIQPVMKESPQIIHSRICFLNGFAAYLRSVGKSACTLHNKFTSGHSLFVPYLFTDEELTRLFRVIDTDSSHKNTFQRILFSVYFRMVYTCGMRPSESRLLKKSHVDLKSGEITILCSKERKSRIVVMSDDMLQLAKKYRLVLDLTFPDSEAFFPSIHGSVSAASFYQKHLVRLWASANSETPADFLPRVRVYDLRHRFATAAIHRWLDQKEDISSKLPYLQMYMGHRNLSSTTYYVHLLPENLVKTAGIDWESFGAIFPGAELWQG